MQTAEARVMGRRHLDSQSTAVPNHLLTGLWEVKALSPSSTCLQEGSLSHQKACRVETRYAVTRSHFRPPGPLSVCWETGSGSSKKKNSLFTNVPSFHPKAGWHPGIRGERGVSQWPYSHHQATDHPGHHPDSLGDDPKRQPEGRSLRSWDKGPRSAAVHLSPSV